MMKKSLLRFLRGLFSCVRHGLLILRPMSDQLTHYNVSDGVGGFKRRQISRKAGHALHVETVCRAHAFRLAIEVADGAQDEDAIEVHAAGVREKLQRLQ